MFILLNWRSHGYSGTSYMQVVISDVSEAQLTASKNSLRGGLARFIGNCPDILYFLSALYLLMRYYRSGNFLSFHSAQCHSAAKVAFKRHVIINTTQLLSMCNNVQRLPSCIVILSIWSPLEWFRLAKRKHKEDPTAVSAFVEETIGRVRWPKLSQADFNQRIVIQSDVLPTRWTESAEEASAGAELVVEAILEDLQVSTSLEGTWKSTSLECTLKVPRKYRIHMTLVWYSLYYKIVVKPSLDLINKRRPLTQMDVDMCVCVGWGSVERDGNGMHCLFKLKCEGK